MPSKKTPRKRKERQPVGRPTLYNDDVGQKVCKCIIEGYTLRQIGELPKMPGKSTIISWLSIHKEFQDQYARAHETRALVMADEVLEISDDSTNDWVERENKDGQRTLVLNEDHLQRVRLRVETRKWWMGKANSKYAQQMRHSNDPDNPMPEQTVGVVLIPAKVVEDEPAGP
jgi:hypothetical protein